MFLCQLDGHRNGALLPYHNIPGPSSQDVLAGDSLTWLGMSGQVNPRFIPPQTDMGPEKHPVEDNSPLQASGFESPC